MTAIKSIPSVSINDAPKGVEFYTFGTTNEGCASQ